MSFSFNVKAADAAAVLALVATEFDQVVASQPIHEKDKDAGVNAATALVGVLDATADKDISVHISGSLSWHGIAGTENQSIQGAHLSVSAALSDRAAVAETPVPQGSDQGGA